MLIYGAPMIGMPKMDVAAMLGSMLSPGMPAPASGAWWVGMMMHFINGTIISPLIYAYSLYSLSGAPWVKGATWGLILWASLVTVDARSAPRGDRRAAP